MNTHVNGVAIVRPGISAVFTFTRAQLSIDGTTAVTIETSPDLATWPTSYTVPTGAASNTLTIPQSATIFVRLKVLLPAP